MKNNNKPTKATRFNELLTIPAVQANADLVAFIEHELELLAKKNVSSGKETAAQKANTELKGKMLAAMEIAKPYRAGDFTKIAEFSALSLPKVTSMLTQMVTAKMITRFEEKGVAYFVRNA